MNTLESRRSQLEDLEVIEQSIASRFERNPGLYYGYLQKRALIDDIPLSSSITNAYNANRIYKTKRSKRNRKQFVLQQHEIDLFLQESMRKLRDLGSLKGPVNTHSLRDEEATFEIFKQNLEEIKDKYKDLGSDSLFSDVNEEISKHAMFSALTTDSKPVTILSRSAKDLRLNDVFSREEQYGEYLDLDRFHSSWLNVIRSTECTLLQFYSILEKFLDDRQYILAPPMDRKNGRYAEFLVEISNYLEKFFQKANVLLNHTKLERRIQSEFSRSLATPLHTGGKGFYCIACCKWFKVPTVFDSHLTGKHHKNNLSKRSKHLQAEYKLHRYLTLLSEEFRRTREFTERKVAFTAEERMQEMARLNHDYHAPDYGPDEKEQEDPDSNKAELDKNSALGGSFDLPLGADGLPIPYWLYKLQGLDVEYSCEICTNQTYKGRRAFEKHFLEPTHTFHLKCLGIEPSITFKGITGIQEAQDLWRQTSSRNRPQTQKKIDLEVEDQEGNVLTQKVYQELKKQGLV